VCKDGCDWEDPGGVPSVGSPAGAGAASSTNGGEGQLDRESKLPDIPPRWRQLRLVRGRLVGVRRSPLLTR